MYQHQHICAPRFPIYSHSTASRVCTYLFFYKFINIYIRIEQCKQKALVSNILLFIPLYYFIYALFGYAVHIDYEE